MAENDIVIPSEKIMKILATNLEEILKDVMTGYNSPIKKIFSEDTEFVTELQVMAKKVFSEIMSSPDFQEKLKDRLLASAVEAMLKR